VNDCARITSGADAFRSGSQHRDTIAKLVKAMVAPLNILMSTGMPHPWRTIKDRSRAGQRRSAVMRATLGLAGGLVRN